MQQEPSFQQRASQVPSAKQLLSQLPLFSQRDKATANKVLTCMLDRYKHLLLCKVGPLNMHELPFTVIACSAVVGTTA